MIIRYFKVFQLKSIFYDHVIIYLVKNNLISTSMTVHYPMVILFIFV